MNAHPSIRRAAPALLVATLLAAFVADTARAADVTPLAIGSPAPDFDLPGVDGKRHALAEYKDAKVLVVLFTSNHCPTAQAYEDRLMQFHRDYAPKGVALVAINPNDPQAVRLDELGYTDLGDTLEDMKMRAADRGFPFPYLDDGGQGQAVSRAYGAVATPHVFVFDAARKLRYQGRIDDAETGAAAVKRPDLRDAVDALLAGSAPPAETTKVFGCSIKWADKREDAKRAVEKWDRETATIRTIDLAGVKALAANAGEKAPLRLVNVWATWCGPCIAEMPELVTMHRMYRGRAFELVTISIDAPDQQDAALKVLNDRHVSATNYLYAGGDDHDALVNALDPKGWHGPIPFTALIAPGGEIVYRENGAFDPRKLKRALADHLGRTYASDKPGAKKR